MHVRRKIQVQTEENGYIVHIMNGGEGTVPRTKVFTDENELYDELARWIAFSPPEESSDEAVKVGLDI